MNYSIFVLQADNEFQSDNGFNHYGYLVYFGVLVVWEVIPTYLIVVFFRVRMPLRSAVSNTTKVTNIFNILSLVYQSVFHYLFNFTVYPFS